MEEIKSQEDIDKFIKNNDVMLLKFDNENSKYDEYINNLNYKVINITDSEIIEFYEIEILPTIFIYKNSNLIDSITGFHSKSVLEKKINSILYN